MTREQFIESHRHELAGLALDAAMAGRSGAELALWSRMMMMKINDRLGRIYDSFHPPAQKSTEVKR